MSSPCLDATTLAKTMFSGATPFSMRISTTLVIEPPVASIGSRRRTTVSHKRKFVLFAGAMEGLIEEGCLLPSSDILGGSLEYKNRDWYVLSSR